MPIPNWDSAGVIVTVLSWPKPEQTICDGLTSESEEQVPLTAHSGLLASMPRMPNLIGTEGTPTGVDCTPIWDRDGAPWTECATTVVLLSMMGPRTPSSNASVKTVRSKAPSGTRPGVGAKTSWRNEDVISSGVPEAATRPQPVGINR